jgi:hypothetical protein
MRRLIIAWVLASLLGVGTGPALAQSPSPRIAEGGQRIEVPEAGYALALPEGWTLEIQEVVEGTDSPDGTTEETRSIWSYAFAPDGTASCLLLEDRLEGPVDDSTAALDETAAYHRSRYEPVLVEMSSVALPMGRAIRFVVDYAGAGGEGVGAIYLLSDGDALIVMSCVAADPPDDDWWHSIAESFEFLPAEQ